MARMPGGARRVAARSREAEGEHRDVVVQVAAVEVAYLVDQPAEQRVVADPAEIERRRPQGVLYQVHQALRAEAVRAAPDPPLDQPVGVKQHGPAVPELHRPDGPVPGAVEPGRRTRRGGELGYLVG